MCDALDRRGVLRRRHARRGRCQTNVGTVLAIALASLAGVDSAHADVIEVPGDFATIQAAVDAAQDGDEIVVAPGTYTGVGSAPVVDLSGKAITLRSSGGRDVTFIDGERARRCVVCASGEGPDTVIEGFTIQRGFDGSANGGGMFNAGSSPTVRHCAFVGNGLRFDTLFGGGMYNENASPAVTDCEFRSNGAFLAGGGMANEVNSSPTVTRCLFRTNGAGAGGGMSNGSGAAPLVVDCTFDRNLSDDGKLFGGSGGGLSCTSDTDAVVRDCTFTGNETGETGFGGAVWAGAGLFERCRFEGNASDFGGGLSVDGGAVTLRECVVTGNAAIAGAGLATFAPGPVLVGTAVCGNTPDQIDGPWQDGGGNTVSAECPPCPADFDGDGDVGFADLLVLLAAWGCADCPDLDLDESGTVNFADLLLLLAAWGACLPPAP